ncbi:group II intron maturase-specific domain-containing protein [Bradyrhizobium erythrophlei]|uniref:group II intron maturase-specific domain-containing protein n=1 Tax=Bradyrhizobium erythrophlei TaxID=1437360 RepID=UPI0035EBA84A
MDCLSANHSVCGLRWTDISQPIVRVISLINPMLRRWVNYFGIGHSSEFLSYIKIR